MDIKDLYQKTIREYAKNDQYFQKIENPDVTIEAYNPYCGDQFQLYINWQNDRVQSAHFHGYGCTISKASTAILVESIQGKDRTEVSQLIHQFKRILQKENIEDAPEKLIIFQAATAFPGRETCATLSWDALEEQGK